MVTFYSCRWATRSRYAFYNIGVNSALCQPGYVFYVVGFIIKYFNEGITNGFSLFLWVVNTCQSIQKPFGSINPFNVKSHTFVLRQHIFKFIFTKQSIVHKNTIQVFSDGFIEQNRRYCRIYASRKPQNYFIIAYFILKFLYRFLYKRLWCPVLVYPGNMHQKVFQ